MMDEMLRSKLETLAHKVADTWPLDQNGVCRFCGVVHSIPGPRSEPYEAVNMLLDHHGHQASCVWVWAREAVKLLG